MSEGSDSKNTDTSRFSMLDDGYTFDPKIVQMGDDWKKNRQGGFPGSTPSDPTSTFNGIYPGTMPERDAEIFRVYLNIPKNDHS